MLKAPWTDDAGGGGGSAAETSWGAAGGGFDAALTSSPHLTYRCSGTGLAGEDAETDSLARQTAKQVFFRQPVVQPSFMQTKGLYSGSEQVVQRSQPFPVSFLLINLHS